MPTVRRTKSMIEAENFVRELIPGTFRGHPAFFADPGRLICYWKPYMWRNEEIRVDRGWKVYNKAGDVLGIISPAPTFAVRMSGDSLYLRGRAPKDIDGAVRRFVRTAHKKGIIS